MSPAVRLLLGLVLMVLIAGCGPAAPTPDMAATEEAIAQHIFATLTAAAPTATPPVQEPVEPAPQAPTEMPTATPVPPTNTPAIPPTLAVVLLPTATPVPPTLTPTPSGPGATVNVPAINVRSGPGTGFAVVGSANQGDWLAVQGRNEDGSWLEIIAPGGVAGWVSADLVTANMDVDAIALAAVIPTPPPPPTPIPEPTATPAVAAAPEAPAAAPVDLPGLHDRQRIGMWEIQPERVHNEKTVWHYGDPTTAMGTYAIVIILAKNLAPGTTSPSDSIWFVLRDDQGRVYDYSDPLTTERSANIAAAWQFVVHPTPFRDVDPGVETPMLLLWDVAQDVQSLTLLAGDNNSIVTWDLGNFSNIPPFEK